MPGLLSRLADARERQVLSHAREVLDPSDEVLGWLRVRHPDHRGRGFIYLTSRCYVVYWSGKGSTLEAIPLKDILAWGVDRASDKGPVLGIETDSVTTFVEMIVGTDGMVTKVNEFLETFARYAPAPREQLKNSSHPSDYEAKSGIKVQKERKTVAGHTRRVGFTVAGVVILLAGIVLLFIPGPGILVSLLGLSILAREYDWAEDLMHWAKARYRTVADRLKERTHST